MSAYILLEALKQHLEPQLAVLPLPVRGRDGQGHPVPLTAGVPTEQDPVLRPARIHLGSMPSTAPEAFSAAPFIVLQPMSGFNRDGLSHVRVALRLCIVSDDLEEAENDLQNLISQVCLSVQSLPDGVLDKRFRLTDEGQGETLWERPDEQVYPFLQAHIFTTWQSKGVSHVTV